MKDIQSSVYDLLPEYTWQGSEDTLRTVGELVRQEQGGEVNGEQHCELCLWSKSVPSSTFSSLYACNFSARATIGHGAHHSSLHPMHRSTAVPSNLCTVQLHYWRYTEVLPFDHDYQRRFLQSHGLYMTCHPSSPNLRNQTIFPDSATCIIHLRLVRLTSLGFAIFTSSHMVHDLCPAEKRTVICDACTCLLFS